MFNINLVYKIMIILICIATCSTTLDMYYNAAEYLRLPIVSRKNITNSSQGRCNNSLLFCTKHQKLTQSTTKTTVYNFLNSIIWSISYIMKTTRISTNWKTTFLHYVVGITVVFFFLALRDQGRGVNVIISSKLVNLLILGYNQGKVLYCFSFTTK